ncbi:NUDIX hydrolase domain-like protein [Fusarium venenatum]|uniref:NUDIX hydrolase domain-like protein n=1 Tax=Fusarium venenatum TaxID=56646 RepID=UPI001D1F7ACF|nr:NUDIX hydrolase domain-like protein [Fusarium venenatum]
MSAPNTPRAGIEFLDLTGIEVQKRCAGPPVHKITVGAAVLRHSHDSQRDTQILLLKRNSHEKYYPNVFEMPGGKFNTGENLRAALTREVNEESGLVVSGILTPLATLSYTATKTAKSPMTGDEEVIHRYAQQFSYVVTIEGDGSESRVRQAEHSKGSWFGVSDLSNIPMTGEMRNLVVQALSENKDCTHNA